jgi:hypothetical protein
MQQRLKLKERDHLLNQILDGTITLKQTLNVAGVFGLDLSVDRDKQWAFVSTPMNIPLP